MAGGRPSKFKPEFVEQAGKLCRLGATDEEIADFFRIDRATLYRWKHDQQEFCDALKAGKEAADNRVETSLYHKAVGYTYDAVKIFMPANASAPVYAPYREHVPPDTTAGIFWLKNRKPDEWRDKQEISFKSTADVRDLSTEEILKHLNASRVAEAQRGDGKLTKVH